MMENIHNIKQELKLYIDALLQENLSKQQKLAIKYFELIYVDGKKDIDTISIFPNSTRDQRYQWKSRAVKMIAPYMSEETRKYISEKTRNKFAEIILNSAIIFLKKCQG